MGKLYFTELTKPARFYRNQVWAALECIHRFQEYVCWMYEKHNKEGTQKLDDLEACKCKIKMQLDDL